MASEHVRTVQGYLRKVGWPLKVDGKIGPQTRDAIRQFQRGYTYTRLPRTGRCPRGSRTYYRLRRCASDGSARKGYGGHCSRNFRFREFASKGNGWIKVDRYLVLFLERYRKRVGHGVTPVSPYRDPTHNRRVGGAICSYHTDACGHEGGHASDLVPELTVRQVIETDKDGYIGGIGHMRSTGDVRHADTGPKRRWSYPLRALIPGVRRIPEKDIEVFAIDDPVEDE